MNGVDLNWPLEWEDGTPAWISNEIEHGGAFIASATKPYGVAVAQHEKLRLWTCIVEGSGHPKLRNVDLPEIRFEDGERPIKGTFLNAGRVMLTHPKGFTHEYHWPSWKPAVVGSSKLTIMTRKQLAQEEEQAKEQEALEESDFYGLF